jgi:hypothetical protein
VRTLITMYDTSQNGQFPAGAAAYAAYVDGGVGDQPNYQHVTAAYPGARHLSIALFPVHDADALRPTSPPGTPARSPAASPGPSSTRARAR